MRKHARDLLLMLSLLALILFWSSQKAEPDPIQAVREDLGLKDAEPLILVYGNPHSRTVKKFVSAVQRFLSEEDSAITLALTSTARTPFKVTGERVKTWRNDELLRHFTPNHYVFFADKGAPVSKGLLFAGPQRLIKDIRMTFDMASVRFREDYIDAGDNIHRTIFAAALGDDPLEAPVNIFVFFENICMVCPSGKTLTTLVKLQAEYPEASFKLVSVASYRPDQLASFIEDHRVTTPIIQAGAEFQAFWRQLDEELNYRPHLLQGLILATNSSGSVVFDGTLDRIGELQA